MNLFKENRVAYNKRNAIELAVAKAVCTDSFLGSLFLPSCKAIEDEEAGRAPEPGFWDKAGQKFGDAWTSLSVWLQKASGSAERTSMEVGGFFTRNWREVFGEDYPVPLVEYNFFGEDKWSYYNYHFVEYDKLYIAKLNECKPLRSKLNELLALKEANEKKIDAKRKEIAEIDATLESTKARHELFNTYEGGNLMYRMIQKKEVNPLLERRKILLNEVSQLLTTKVGNFNIKSLKLDGLVALDNAIEMIQAELDPYMVDADYFLENRERSSYWRDVLTKPAEPVKPPTPIIVKEGDRLTSDPYKAAQTPSPITVKKGDKLRR